MPSEKQLLVPTFYGKVEGSMMLLSEVRKYDALVRSLEGQEIEIVVQKRRKHRTSPQNRYFHGVVLQLIAEAAGYEQTELPDLKDALKHKFLKTRHPGTIGLDRYRQTVDEIHGILQAVLDGRMPAGDAMFTVFEKVSAIRNEDDRTKLEVIPSTSSLSTVEFNEFIEDCRRWAAQTLGLNIPDPTKT